VSDEAASRLGKGSAAELLSAWRAAERDRVAVEETLDVARAAELAAGEAARAAEETADAARLSLEAAQKAEIAAKRTADAAGIVAKAAIAGRGVAEAHLAESQGDEIGARNAYHDAQDRGFPKP
jgi:hypothetical protein